MKRKKRIEPIVRQALKVNEISLKEMVTALGKSRNFHLQLFERDDMWLGDLVALKELIGHRAVYDLLNKFFAFDTWQNPSLNELRALDVGDAEKYKRLYELSNERLKALSESHDRLEEEIELLR